MGFAEQIPLQGKYYYLSPLYLGKWLFLTLKKDWTKVISF